MPTQALLRPADDAATRPTGSQPRTHEPPPRPSSLIPCLIRPPPAGCWRDGWSERNACPFGPSAQASHVPRLPVERYTFSCRSSMIVGTMPTIRIDNTNDSPKESSDSDQYHGYLPFCEAQL